jgi:hypothetical protein
MCPARLHGNAAPGPPLTNPMLRRFATFASAFALAAVLVAVLLLWGCGDGVAGPTGVAESGPGPDPGPPLPLPGGVCEVSGEVVSLNRAIHESSGIVRSRRHPGVFWTHNDSGGTPELFAVDRAGRLLGRVRLPGVRNRDWEDLAYGPCGDPGTDLDQPLPERHRCLWIGEFGDNRQVYDTAYLIRVPEPHPQDLSTQPPDVFPFGFEDGPRDAEALFFDAEDRAWIVSKGRPIADPPGTAPARGNGRVTAYRISALSLAVGELAVARRVQELTATPPPSESRITAGASSPAASRVALRTYVDLQFYRFAGDTLRPVLPGRGVDLRLLREPQGEGLDVEDDGRVVLSSEEGSGGVPGSLVELRCRVPAGG